MWVHDKEGGIDGLEQLHCITLQFVLLMLYECVVVFDRDHVPFVRLFFHIYARKVWYHE